jgi:c-di-AMP phosphodiesterase-like protein
MREKFELACKIIGLMFFCTSIFVLLAAIAFFITITYIPEIPQSTMKLLTQSQITELQDMSNSMRNMYSLTITFFGIIEMLLGLYLMKSNNLFVKLCYPARSGSSNHDSFNDIKLDTKAEETHKHTKETSEKKYAPPGYFQ